MQKEGGERKETDEITGERTRRREREEGGRREAGRLILALYRRKSIHFKFCGLLHNREEIAMN